MILFLLACGGGPVDVAAAGVEADLGALAQVGAGVTVDCGSTTAGPPAQDCVSGVLACGATVSGTTLGGDSTWGDEFYASAFCFPPGGDHSGSERVYTLQAPAYTEVTVQMRSSCADLDLVAMTSSVQGCPSPKHLVSECEGDTKLSGDGMVKIQSFAPHTYLVGVDGKNGAVGEFELTVSCKPLRSQAERSKALPR